MLAALDGSCRAPVAGLADAEGDRLIIEGLLLKPDASAEVCSRHEGARDDSQVVGCELARELGRCADPCFG